MGPLEIAASGVVTNWLDAAIAGIDDRLGEGFAARHPELVGAFITACAAQVRNDRLEDDIGATLEAISKSLDGIAATIAAHE